MEKKRKLKHSWHRLPEESISRTEIAKVLVKETGYPYDKINYITKCFFEEVAKNIVDGKIVYLEGVGRIYATIRPPRKVVDFKNKPDELGRTLGVKGMKVKTKQVGAGYQTRFKPSASLKRSVNEKDPPTQEQVDNLYVD